MLSMNHKILINKYGYKKAKVSHYINASLQTKKSVL